MSYQIKSTPYFQRMLTKSKRNGELQRLKEEYERIKDFNDHTIALRIRQVRLRRLFREIQDINSTVSTRGRSRRQPPKTYAQVRAEELSKAREIGTEYSRENGMRIPRYDAIGARSSMSMINRHSLDTKPSSTARRIHYGNTMSAFNMKKFRQSQLRSYERMTADMSHELNCVSSNEIDKMEKLHKRTDYKSSVSNVSTDERHHNSKATVDDIEMQGESSSRPDIVKNYTFVMGDDGNMNVDETQLEYIRATQEIDEDEDDEQYVPIANVLRNPPQLFRNLRVAENAVRERFNQMSQEVLEEDFDSVPDDNAEEENMLRKISNNRNLPLSNFRKFVLPTIESVDDTQVIENEEVIKISRLNEHCTVSHEETFEDDSQVSDDREQEKEPPAFEQLTPKAFFSERSQNATPCLKNKPIPILSQQPKAPTVLMHNEVKDFVKLYEPFPHNEERPQPVKENFESGVAKLRSIFEHQGD